MRNHVPINVADSLALGVGAHQTIAKLAVDSTSAHRFRARVPGRPRPQWLGDVARDLSGVRHRDDVRSEGRSGSWRHPKALRVIRRPHCADRLDWGEIVCPTAPSVGAVWP